VEVPAPIWDKSSVKDSYSIPLSKLAYEKHDETARTYRYEEPVSDILCIDGYIQNRFTLVTGLWWHPESYPQWQKRRMSIEDAYPDRSSHSKEMRWKIPKIPILSILNIKHITNGQGSGSNCFKFEELLRLFIDEKIYEPHCGFTIEFKSNIGREKLQEFYGATYPNANNNCNFKRDDMLVLKPVYCNDEYYKGYGRRYYDAAKAVATISGVNASTPESIKAYIDEQTSRKKNEHAPWAKAQEALDCLISQLPPVLYYRPKTRSLYTEMQILEKLKPSLSKFAFKWDTITTEQRIGKCKILIVGNILEDLIAVLENADQIKRILVGLPFAEGVSMNASQMLGVFLECTSKNTPAAAPSK
jgi:hypothetical protein